VADGASNRGGGEVRDVTVRDAALEDLEIVARWIGTAEECRLWAGPAVSFPIEPRNLAVEIGFGDADDVLLADGAGTAGFGQLVWRADGRAHLARVIVRPDARGRGLGRVLVRALVERAAARGARRATLNVYPQNEAALRLYEAAGFTASHRQGEPACPHGALYMTLALESV
jgi:[ribosomal protein S18]-alanine N-acetyltransferase